jgi:hypothetical protein
MTAGSDAPLAQALGGIWVDPAHGGGSAFLPDA